MIETEEQALKVLSDYGGESLVKQGIQALEEKHLLRGIQRIYPLGKEMTNRNFYFQCKKKCIEKI